LQRSFGDEEVRLAYLERLRWPDGFRFPACGGGRRLAHAARALGLPRLSVGDRGHRRDDLRRDEDAACDVVRGDLTLVSAKQVMSALQLQRIMGLGSP
jgi:hypothetical protein